MKGIPENRDPSGTLEKPENRDQIITIIIIALFSVDFHITITI